MAGASARILNRSVVAFDVPEWKPPEMVLLDTNVAAEALLTGASEHAECVALFQRLTDEKTTVVFNGLLEIELWETVFNADLRDRHPRKQMRHVRFTQAARCHAAAALDEAQRRWERMIAPIDWVRVELHEVADAVPDLMRSLPEDATLHTTAARLATTRTHRRAPAPR